MFPKELCQQVIRNSELLEGGVIEEIQKIFFKVMNVRLENRLKAIGGWKGQYELVSGEADETLFAPAAWPESQDGRYRACYKLTALETDDNTYWLSSALGVNGVKLCLRFWVEQQGCSRRRWSARGRPAWLVHPPLACAQRGFAVRRIPAAAGTGSGNSQVWRRGASIGHPDGGGPSDSAGHASGAFAYV